MARLFSLCLGAALASASVAQAHDITLQDIVQMQRVNSAITTSDGDYIAYTRVRPRTAYEDDDGPAYTELFVKTPDSEHVPYISGDVQVSQIRFSDDENYIHFIAKREDDEHNTLYRIPLRGGESSQSYSHDTAINSYSIGSDGNTFAFTTREAAAENNEELAKKGFRAEVFEEELRLGQVFIHTLNSDDDSEARQIELNEHVLSAALRPQHEQLLLRVAATPFVDDSMMLSNYLLIDFDGNEVVRLQTEGKLGAARFSDDGSQLAVLGAEDQHDPAVGRILHANLANGETRDLLPGYEGHVRDMLWQDSEHLLILGETGTETEILRFNVRSNEHSQLLEPGRLIVQSLVNYDDNGRLTILANSPAHPGEVYQLANGELQRITDSNPWLADVEQPRQETIRYTARDGLELEGVMVYPLNYREGQSVPVIMSIHGGPEAHVRNGWNDRYSSPTWYAAAQGFATFFPNYRGSTGRGVEFSQLGQNDYAGKEFDDIVDAKEHLVEAGIADPDRVGITGGSYGGYASAWGATKQTEHFAAAVMFVGISNNLSKFGTTDIPNEMHLVHARSYPWDKWQWYLERSPIYWAEQARTPILIMHGKDDTRVHPSQSMELYRYLKVHDNVPVRLVLYPGEGHGNSRVGSQLDYAMRLMRWMNFYLVEQNDGIPEHELPHAENL
ncbi:alpha/beta hydrolase family protein [Aliidiomarina soli]|uniref:S9 family peptidase n=1 Tax=Aliidiomarina soli TaxID=1928574 RepID=A0A432WJK5_9GAMM|nr:S9 family peptidase [Aliidiomarina soli]RUO33945.1 S9 family peptidase [Aliidiomarina soli]